MLIILAKKELFPYFKPSKFYIASVSPAAALANTARRLPVPLSLLFVTDNVAAFTVVLWNTMSVRHMQMLKSIASDLLNPFLKLNVLFMIFSFSQFCFYCH
jgi:hypothetical protein